MRERFSIMRVRRAIAFQEGIIERERDKKCNCISGFFQSCALTTYAPFFWFSCDVMHEIDLVFAYVDMPLHILNVSTYILSVCTLCWYYVYTMAVPRT